MYGKIFESFFDSSLCQNESYPTRLVFIYFCTKMDQEGYVHCPNAGVLARRVHVTLEEAEKAIEVLSLPDSESTNPENDGRRIEKMPGGYLVLNGPYYRSLKSMEDRRQRTRERVRKHRVLKQCNKKALQGVSCNKVPYDSVSVYKKEKESVREKENKGKGSLEDCKAYAVEIGLPESDGESFFDAKEGNGWMNGKNKVRDWKATMRNWKANGFHPSQKLQPRNAKRSPKDMIPNPKEKDHWEGLTKQQREDLINGK